jgi:hypothetical protein
LSSSKGPICRGGVNAPGFATAGDAGVGWTAVFAFGSATGQKR